VVWQGNALTGVPYADHSFAAADAGLADHDRHEAGPKPRAGALPSPPATPILLMGRKRLLLR
jgi:hypothetical protein